jgi:endonuclease/exonuclease/phosphatase family metal-dependent hydrolase
MLFNYSQIRNCVLVNFFLLVPVLHGQAADINANVVTMNMYVGTDVKNLLAATTLSGLKRAVDGAYNAVLDSDPEECVAAMAKEIAAHQPLLVGLQEAALIRIGPSTLPQTPANSVQVNYLGMLLHDLASLKHPYRTLAILPGIDAQAPGTTGQDVRVTDRTVIIAARTNRLAIRDRHVETYLINLPVPIPALNTTIVDTRGWAAADADFDGVNFRFITTHLENVLPQLPVGGAAIQLAQAVELIAAAAATDIPVIMAADFNANADNPSDPSYPTYRTLLRDRASGRFSDAWKQIHPTNAGHTCCQAANLRNPDSMLRERIDLILYRGPQAESASLAGNRPPDRTRSGRWPSDHAALAATLGFAPSTAFAR